MRHNGTVKSLLRRGSILTDICGYISTIYRHSIKVSMAQLASAGRSCNHIVFIVLLYWDYSIYSVVYHIYCI